MNERARTIKDKEDKIEKYRKQTQELEKFKFVLDYKIKELKHRIGPREKQIQSLQEQKTKMDNEKKMLEVNNNNLHLIVGDLKMKLEGLHKAQAKLMKTIRAQEEQKKQFKDEVYETLNNHLNDYKKLKKGIVRLHKIYVLEEGNRNEFGEADIHSEQLKRRATKENQIQQYHESLRKGKRNHADANSRMIKDHVSLIDVINNLTKQEHTIRLKT